MTDAERKQRIVKAMELITAASVEMQGAMEGSRDIVLLVEAMDEYHIKHGTNPTPLPEFLHGMLVRQNLREPSGYGSD